MKLYKNIIIAAVLSILIVSCKKHYLDVKPSTSIILPNNLADYQLMLDNGNLNSTSSLPQLSGDDYYLINEEAWQASSPTERNAYIWDKDLFGGQVARADWYAPYLSIFYANSILSGLSKTFGYENDEQANDIKGQAYFTRAFAYFDLVKNFSKPYDKSTAATDLGLPIKLSPNVDQIIKRSNLEQTYSQIIFDLNQASYLLHSDVSSQYRNRPSKPAALALFARLYLSMRKYTEAERYADSCLNLYNHLIDYNKISQTSSTPFTNTNIENIFWAIQSNGSYDNSLNNSSVNINVDTNLLASYLANDLRRSIFFIKNNSTGLTKTKRGYSASPAPFVGLATDEIYLIKAECAARRKDYSTALNFINTLLINRYKSGTFIPYTSQNTLNILETILRERRKELVWRAGLRWDDLRRFNKEGANITLTRKRGAKNYTLLPNSPLYIFPIPQDEINLSGIEQNVR